MCMKKLDVVWGAIEQIKRFFCRINFSSNEGNAVHRRSQLLSLLLLFYIGGAVAQSLDGSTADDPTKLGRLIPGIVFTLLDDRPESTTNCPENCSEGCIQYSVNGLQCAADVANTAYLANAISINESQNDCFAPCGVHFQAEVTGNFQVESNFHHLAYHWQFGDDGSSFRSLGSDFPFSNNANRAQGSKAGHVFERPGEYQVVLRVAARNGRFAEATKTIRVLDPLEYFTASQTVCVSSSFRFDGCPSGAIQLSDWDSVVQRVKVSQLARNGSYILLRAGDEFVSKERLLLRDGKHVITRYGNGNDPVISVYDNVSVFHALDTDEFSVSYLQIRGDYNSQTGLGDAYRSRGFFLGLQGMNISSNATVYRMVMSGLGICIAPSGGEGHVFADNKCTNWQDYASLQGSVNRVAYIGNSFKQDINARSGPDSKLFSITSHAGDGSSVNFSYDFALAGDHDLGIRIVNANDTKIHMNDENGYALNLANTTVTFDTPPADGSVVEIFHRRWADHGSLRSAHSFSLVVAQNDFFNNVGWFGGGVHHNPSFRYNTYGDAGHSGVIVENRMEGGTMAAVFETANGDLLKGAGKIIAERNIFIGTEPTYVGVRSVYGNMTMRNNVIVQPNVLSTTNTYSPAIYFWEDYVATTPKDIDNFSGPVEIYNNTIINLAKEDEVSGGPVISFFDFEGIAVQDHHSGTGKVFTDFMEVNNLVYAPQVGNVNYHINPGFNAVYVPSNVTAAENNDLPGLFDTLWGNTRSSTTIMGAVE